MILTAGKSRLVAAFARWWRNPRQRGLIYQTGAIALTIAAVWWLGDNTAGNLAKQGKTAGFDFLHDTAGFAINFHLIPYEATDPISRVFWVGVVNTLLISCLGIIGATILGFVVGIAQLSPNPIIRGLAVSFVEFFRNIPLLLQIFFWYFTVLRPLPQPRHSLVVADSFFLNARGLYTPKPLFAAGAEWAWWALAAAALAVWWLTAWARRRQRLTGQTFPVFWSSVALLLLLPLLAFAAAGLPITFSFPEFKGFNIIQGSGLWVPPELIALLLALSVYTASFIAEIVRAGMQSVSGGQMEACRALGLRRNISMRLVIIPQALRVIVPLLTNQYLNITKNSSLAVAIAYPELVSVFAGIVLTQTGHEIEVIFITMAFYLVISLLIATFMGWFNARFALLKDR